MPCGSRRHWLGRFFHPEKHWDGPTRRSNADQRSRGPQLRMSTLAYPVLITPSIIFFVLAGRWENITPAQSCCLRITQTLTHHFFGSANGTRPSNKLQLLRLPRHQLLHQRQQQKRQQQQQSPRRLKNTTPSSSNRRCHPTSRKSSFSRTTQRSALLSRRMSPRFSASALRPSRRSRTSASAPAAKSPPSSRFPPPLR